MNAICYTPHVTTSSTDEPTLETQILRLLRRWGRGSVFANSDFFTLATDTHVACCLCRLKCKGIIRPLMRGLFEYPRRSKLLGEYLAPDLHCVAAALARKHGWHIQASGNAALNYLGWSTQVPTRILYLSNGPNRCYNIDNRTLCFRHASIKEARLGTVRCELFIQAIKELGESALSQDYLPKIRAALSLELAEDIKKTLPLLTEKYRIILHKILLNNKYGPFYSKTNN